MVETVKDQRQTKAGVVVDIGSILHKLALSDQLEEIENYLLLQSITQSCL